MSSQAVDRPVLFTGARIVDPSRDLDAVGDLLIVDGRIAAAGPQARGQGAPEGAEIVDCAGRAIVPGLVDMRVFVGEPGAEHRETLATASHAAAAGGVTTMITMPDTEPAIDDPALVDFVLRRARDTADVRVRPMAAVTKGLNGEILSEFGLLQEAGAVAFTEGRRSLRSAQVMRNALTYARDFAALVVHHTEDEDLAHAGLRELVAALRRAPDSPAEALMTELSGDGERGLLAGLLVDDREWPDLAAQIDEWRRRLEIRRRKRRIRQVTRAIVEAQAAGDPSLPTLEAELESLQREAQAVRELASARPATQPER